MNNGLSWFSNRSAHVEHGIKNAIVAPLPPPDVESVEADPMEEEEPADPESATEPAEAESPALGDELSLLDVDDVVDDESVGLDGEAGVEELAHPPAASRTAAAQTMSRVDFMVVSETRWD